MRRSGQAATGSSEATPIENVTPARCAAQVAARSRIDVSENLFRLPIGLPLKFPDCPGFAPSSLSYFINSCFCLFI